MRKGDKILVYVRGSFAPARVVHFRFAKGACRFAYASKNVHGFSCGAKQGTQWVRGWDENSDAAKALLVAHALLTP